VHDYRSKERLRAVNLGTHVMCHSSRLLASYRDRPFVGGVLGLGDAGPPLPLYGWLVNSLLEEPACETFCRVLQARREGSVCQLIRDTYQASFSCLAADEQQVVVGTQQ
jgi:hypothetical protein